MLNQLFVIKCCEQGLIDRYQGKYTSKFEDLTEVLILYTDSFYLKFWIQFWNKF